MANIISRIRNAGTNVAQRAAINIIPAGDISVTVVDDEANDEVEVTITNAGSGTTTQNVAGLKHIVGRYSFAVHGGAQGAILLTDVNGNGVTLASTEAVIAVNIHVKTAITSGGSATVTLGTAGSAGAAVILTDDLTVLGTPANVSVLSSFNHADDYGALEMTIGVADLTAGIIDVHVLVAEAIA